MSTATTTVTSEEEFELRRGPWTLDEDNILIHQITCHGEGRWNLLAKNAGLKRSGKSCRLRWLNYLKPDIKRGNLTPQEQLLILELHSKWGNRWSKIAQHLPGRTDNEIKNYWRTRVQKQARILKIDSNSEKFFEAIRCFWMPRLVEQMEQSSSLPLLYSSSSSSSFHPSTMEAQSSAITSLQPSKILDIEDQPIEDPSSMNSSTICFSDDLMKIQEHPTSPAQVFGSYDLEDFNLDAMSAVGPNDFLLSECQMAGTDWTGGDGVAGTLWNMDELWQL
ncbi:hypothetical protein U1Q18_029586 [Sarracenia purpurea var. burkii]